MEAVRSPMQVLTDLLARHDDLCVEAARCICAQQVRLDRCEPREAALRRELWYVLEYVKRAVDEDDLSALPSPRMKALRGEQFEEIPELRGLGLQAGYLRS